jgi:hypothetical protein
MAHIGGLIAARLGRHGCTNDKDISVMAKETTYWVQPFRRAGAARLARGDLRRYETEARARRAGAAAARRLGGAVVFAVSGDPEFEHWEQPRHIASLGETPSVVF